MNVSLLLLAAGSSTRMGQSKQLMKIDGQPMLVRTAREALAACQDVTVVLGAEAESHRMILRGTRVNTVENNEWQRGMGNTLKFGLTELRNANPGLDAVLIMVCDQPAVTSDHLRKLIERAGRSSKSIIASSYKDTLGVPALFRKQHFGQLAAIADGVGAAKLIREKRDEVEAIALPHGEIDLDTLNDYLMYTAPTT